MVLELNQQYSLVLILQLCTADMATCLSQQKTYLFVSLVPRLYPRTQTNCKVKRGKAWDILSCDVTSDDVQVDRLYRKLVPTQASRFAIVLESSL